MSDVNPYQTGPEPVGENPPRQAFGTAGSGIPFDDALIRKVRIEPINLLKRAHAFLGDRYWLFMGITLVALLVGSLVPMNIILGALTVGVYLCLIEHEARRPVELSMLFKGFEYFVDSLIVILVLMAVSFAIILPLVIIMMVVMFVVIAAIEQGDATAAMPILMFAMMFLMFVVIIVASIFIYLPFLFTFQLIADQKLKAADAMRLGWKGSKKNFGGIFLLLLVFGLIGFVGALFCYIPLFFFLPLAYAAIFLLYRDVYRDVAPPPTPVPVADPAD
ncbi:MAG: hypothetical protein WD119_01015 [Pirellulaceae bacterium]